MSSRRFIIICDGGETSIPTNVTRFWLALSDSSDIFQLALYNLGIGTQDLDKPWGLDTIINSASKDLLYESEKLIVSVYRFLVDNYRLGDALYFFGFSRGAFIARVIANMVARFGILLKADSWAFEDVIHAHKEGHLEDLASTCHIISDEVEGHTIPASPPRVYKVEIEVLGCWDTVANFGAPWNTLTDPGGVSGQFQHFDASLVEGIKRAFHALALDECRAPYTPTLMHVPQNTNANIDLRQCWFPGAHNNVGGGYPDCALSNLTLAWMIDQCHGLLDFDPDSLDYIADLDRHPSLGLRECQLHQQHHLKPEAEFDIEYQGWGRGMCYDSYKEGKVWTWKYRTPGAYPLLTGGETRETMHASVRERWESSRELGRGLTTGPTAPVWAPVALKGFKILKTRKDTDGLEWEWEWAKRERDESTGGVQIKLVKIPEFPFPTQSGSGAGAEQKDLEYRLRYEHY